jgi:AcrR family transcriptional regulator
VPGTTTGRLVAAALELFGAHGFQPVGVGALAARAGVTTGSLYHHFGSKAGLYLVVRADVERRVLDRLEGAAALRSVGSVADLAPVVLVGVDYLVGAGYARLLGEPHPTGPDGVPPPDEIERFFDEVLPDSAAPLGALLAAAWRITLWRSASGDATARASLDRLLTG